MRLREAALGAAIRRREAAREGLSLIHIFGKEDRLYHIDPETAPIVQDIFTRYANGEPAEKIAASLNERGLRTRTGKPVSYTHLDVYKRQE